MSGSDDKRSIWPRRDADLAVCGGLVLLAFVLGLFPMWDFDVWTHLKTAEVMLERGEWPRTDWFTYTSPDAPWINVYWLFQLGIFGLWTLGGASLLVIVKAMFGALTVGLALLARRPGWSFPLTTAAWIVPLLSLGGRLYVRPETVSLVLLAATLTVLFHARRAPRWAWALPALQLLWANCHGFFVLGLVALAVFWGDEIARRLLPSRLVGQPCAEWRRLVPPSLVALVAPLVNPYGLDGALLPFVQFAKISGASSIQTLIGELRPTLETIERVGWGHPYALAFLGTLVGGAVSFAVMIEARRLPLDRIVLFAGFAYLGLSANRNVGVFAVVAAMVAGWNLAEAAHARRTRRASYRRAAAPGARAHGVLGVALVVAIVSIVSGAFYEWAREGREFGVGERADWFAHDAAIFLSQPGLPEHIAAFNMSQAALAIFHAGPERKVLFDPRLEVNTEKMAERYIELYRALLTGDAPWQPRLERLGAQRPAILLDRDTSRPAIARLLTEPSWKLVFIDDVAAVFLDRRLADALGLEMPPPPDGNQR